MHRRALDRLVLTVTVCLAAGGLAAAAAGGSTSAAQFTGKICGLVKAGQLSAADITAPCAQPKSHGSTAIAIYSAHWGANGNAPHWLSIMIMRPRLNAASWYASVRAGAEANRDAAPIKIGAWAYWKTERYNGDRRRGDIMFRAGPYVGQVSLNDDNGAPDEVGIQQALFSIAKTLAAKL